MRRDLVLHPDMQPGPVQRIAAEVVFAAGAHVKFIFALEGATDRILWPPRMAAERRDLLWHRTCFEAFIAPRGGVGYLEFNFSPTSAWAFYRFTGHRAGMADAPISPAPQVAFALEAARAELTTLVSASSLTDLIGPPPYDIGLSAIIEADDGRKTFWALRHPPGAADFHNSYCFAGELSEG